MPRARLCCLLILCMALAGCPVSERHARAIAEAATGADLSAAEVTAYRSGGMSLFAFAVDDPDGQGRWEYRVDARSGQFVGWLARIERRADGDLPDFGPERATELAKECARRFLGDSVDAMVWSQPDAGRRVTSVRGVSPPSGDPPRTGLGPVAVAVVRSDGAVTSYRQYAPPEGDREPLPVAVDEQSARARAEVDFPARERFARCETTTSLSQRDGEVAWQVVTSAYEGGSDGAAPGPSAILSWTVDARTGRILERDLRVGLRTAADLSAFTAKVEANDATRFWNSRWPSRPLGCVGAAMVLTLSGLAAARRRRRASAGARQRQPDAAAEEPASPSWFEA